MADYALKVQTPAVSFIVGLAGSGKSSLLNNLVYDVVFEEGFWLDEEHYERHHAQLVRFLFEGKHCIVVERRFMGATERTSYEAKLKNDVPHLQVNWFFFEKNLENANHNCRSRPPKPMDPTGEAHVAQNSGDDGRYSVPDDGVVIKIHRWPTLAAYEAAAHLHQIGE